MKYHPRSLSTFILSCACLTLGASTALAQFSVVDNFDALTSGAINGQNGWTVVNSGANVTNDPVDILNKVLEVTTTTSRIRKPATIAEGATGTLFFRFRFTGPKNFSIGLSDVDAAGATGAFGDYEAQVNVNNVNNGFNARSAGAFLNTGAILPDTWYNVWVVANNSSDTMRVYLNASPYAPATETDVRNSGGTTDFTFRNGAAANDLIRFLVLTGGAGANGVEAHTQMWLDDVYLDPAAVNLGNPTVTGDPNAPVGFSLQPQSLSAAERATATFIVGVTGAPPRFIQWERNDGGGFVAIAGANAAAYTTPLLLPPDSGAQFRAVVTNAFSSATSDPAVLTVVADNQAPTVARIRVDYPFDRVVVSFSEPVNAVEATSVFNYSMAGVIFNSASLLLGTNVVLTPEERLTAGTPYTLTVSGIPDLAAAQNQLVETNADFVTPRRVCGVIRGDYFLNLSSASFNDQTNQARWPYLYDLPRYFTNFDTGANYADTYGARLSGLFVPPTNGFYVFLLRSDDQSEFYMNTNSVNSADPSGKVRMAYLTGANTGFSTNAFQRATNYLEAGNQYYIEAILREGTGGDYVRLFAIADGEAFPADGATTGSIPGAFLCSYADATTISITRQPQGSDTLENRLITFSADAVLAPAGPAITYQWRRDGSPIAGATGTTYSLFTTTADDGAVFDVVLRALGAEDVVSEPATLRVGVDTQPPVLLSAISLDGVSIDLCFDELLSTNDPGSGPVALDAFSYSVNDSILGITNITWGPDFAKVVLKVDGIVSPGFTVEVGPNFNALEDFKGNQMQNAQIVTGTILGMNYQDIGSVGDPLEPGLTFACDTNRFLMRAGGTDIWNTADGMHFAYVERVGDFDARVSVESLVQREANTKAGLMVRETLDADSRNLAIMVTPPTGRSIYSMQWRDTAAAATVSRHRENSPDAPQNLVVLPSWVRLQRLGQVFNTYFSTNGQDWLLLGSRTNPDMPGSLLVGMASTSHNNAPGQTTEASFSGLSIENAAPAVPPSFTRISAAGGSVTLEFTSQFGVSYILEYKSSLSDAAWQTLTTVSGSGQVMSAPDANPVDPARFYRLRVQ